MPNQFDSRGRTAKLPQVRLTPAELAAVEAGAKALRVSVSEFVRRRLPRPKASS